MRTIPALSVMLTMAGLVSCSTGFKKEAELRPYKPPVSYEEARTEAEGIVNRMSLEEKIEITAEAGYQGIEPWVRELQSHVDGGGNLRDIRKRIEDLGLSVVGAIGFIPWGVADADQRSKARKQALREADLAQFADGI